MSQLNFFITQDEQLARLEELISSELVTLFRGNFFDTIRPKPITNPDDLINFDKIVIWVNNDVIEPQCSTQGLDKYENQYIFDYYKDPIIELDNCIYSEKNILPGRLFYKTGYIDNETVRKLHSKVASKTVRLFSKDLVEISKPFKISPTVKRLINEGYQIELGQGGRIINQTNINCTYPIVIKTSATTQ